MKKTMFLAALMGAVVTLPAMADVTYHSDKVIGEAISQGDWVNMPAAQFALTINLAALQGTTSTTDIILTKSPGATEWGLRTADGTTLYGNWQGGDYQKDANKTTYEQLAALDTDSSGSVQVVAQVDKTGTYLSTMDGSSLYSNSGLKSSTYDTTGYKVTNSDIVTAANKIETVYSELAGSGTLLLAQKTTLSGGGNTDITIDMNGKSVVIAEDTTLNKIGAYNSAAGGITVKEGVTLTAAIDSSWNPGNISLEDNAKIEADHVTLSTNAVSNVTGHGSVHVSGNVETFNGGKINTSADTFTVDGDVTLGVKNAGANNSTLTVSGGEFSVAGTTTVNSGRTLAVTGGTASLADLTINGGTVKLTGGTTSISGTVTMDGGTLNIATPMDITMQSVTLNAGNSITLGTDHSGALTTSALTVNGNSAINADLVMSNGSTLTFNSGVVTMGCAVTLGPDMVLNLTTTLDPATDLILLFDSVDSATLGTHTDTHYQWIQASDVFSSITINDTLMNLDDYVVGRWNERIYLATTSVAPEPATATLSLLALAGLCARRKRH